MEGEPHVVVLEPFYGGSHKQLVDLLVKDFQNVELFTMPDKKWHWRSRTAALHFYQTLPRLMTPLKSSCSVSSDEKYSLSVSSLSLCEETCSKCTESKDTPVVGESSVVKCSIASSRCTVLFASSVLNLAELLALRPDLMRAKKVLYFHENQLVYPVRKQQDRDFQYGYNQILSCLVADVVVFNSSYNKDSFLSHIDSFLKMIPDQKPGDVRAQIESKSEILYFPLVYHPLSAVERRGGKRREKSSDPLHILWPHRWEHDKNPEAFFQALTKLHENGYSFVVSVLGQQFGEIPEVFLKAKTELDSHIINWGYLPSLDDYFLCLKKADVVVSTAIHEFFGVAMLEAVSCGCYPIAPKRLSYPELFGASHLYNTDQQLYNRLKSFCSLPHTVQSSPLEVDLTLYDWNTLRPSYAKLLSVAT